MKSFGNTKLSSSINAPISCAVFPLTLSDALPIFHVFYIMWYHLYTYLFDLTVTKLGFGEKFWKVKWGNQTLRKCVKSIQNNGWL